MEITVDADFYWISNRLMNVSLNYWRGGEGFYAGFVCTQELAAFAARATSEDHEYGQRAAATGRYERATHTEREYCLLITIRNDARQCFDCRNKAPGMTPGEHAS